MERRFAAILATNYTNATSMQAIGMTAFPEIGSVADSLEMLDVPVPRPAKGEVAIMLAASSMHIDEIYAAQGTALGRFYGPKTISELNPFLLGSSVSGTVVALGENVGGLKVGDDVTAIPSEHMEVGSWATYRCMGEKWVRPKPTQLSHVEAAAVTMAACVAWGAIGFAKIGPGDRCAVVGASGAIGIMMLQYLKSLDCYVTAVCSGTSGALVRKYGADEVVDYTKQDFADVATANGSQYDAVFDCVGGRDIEGSAYRSTKKSGVFATVVGPMQYIGEKKLTWPAFIKVVSHIVWRMIVTRLTGGPRYTFGEKYPRFVIEDAMEQLLKYDIRMPVPKTIPFEVNAIANAVRLLTSHRAKGRIVIDFGFSG